MSSLLLSLGSLHLYFACNIDFDESCLQNKLYVYGGVTENKIVTYELWSLDVYTLEWQNETVSTAPSVTGVPFAVAGHTAHMIVDEMFIFYGYNPIYGLDYRIQKYKISECSAYLISGVSVFRKAGSANHVDKLWLLLF